MDDAAFDSALHAAQLKLRAAGKLSLCEHPVQVALMVETAQGIIDNGGLQYFYESDFEEQPAYEKFVEAYRAIGATEAAQLLQRSVELIPFPAPHRDEKARQQWLDQWRGDAPSEFNQLSDRLVGHAEVFPRLASYMQAHRQHFTVP